jgi:hypothetical protein
MMGTSFFYSMGMRKKSRTLEKANRAKAKIRRDKKKLKRLRKAGAAS